jgi:hypothetical protein
MLSMTSHFYLNFQQIDGEQMTRGKILVANLKGAKKMMTTWVKKIVQVNEAVIATTRIYVRLISVDFLVDTDSRTNT